MTATRRGAPMSGQRIPTSSTSDVRKHGPTKARRGELALVPDVPRQARRVTVVVEQLDNGLLRMSMPKTPGWVVAGSTPVQVVQMLRAAFVEAAIANYSDWRGTVYDHPATPQHRRHKPRSRGKRRCDVYAPETWLVDDRGLWVSPGGHRYPEDRAVVQKVMNARRAMGLPERPGRDDSRQRLEALTGTQMALGLDDGQAGQL